MSFWWKDFSKRVVPCWKCHKGIRPNGKKCGYCNGTGVQTKPNQK